MKFLSVLFAFISAGLLFYYFTLRDNHLQNETSLKFQVYQTQIILDSLQKAHATSIAELKETRLQLKEEQIRTSLLKDYYEDLHNE